MAPSLAMLDDSEMSTMLSGQVDNLFQDQTFLQDGKPDRECLSNKSADVLVNTVYYPCGQI